MNLVQVVKNAFTAESVIDWELLKKLVTLGVRMLDNVLDLTFWPLEQQRTEAMNKRRIGVGFTGLGDALIFLRTKYNSEKGRAVAAKIAEVMRDAAYRASIDLAKEKGAFPLFDADKYLQGPFIQRLPEDIKADIRKYGIRNSHLLSIAPTGTLSLAMCDNASNGIEPAFSWFYDRNKREHDGSQSTFRVYDHAYRVWLAKGEDGNGGSADALPDYFVSALEMSAQDHMGMMQAVQPFVDTSISKTVNIPEDYPFESFKELYFDAWKGGLKGLATYRPSSVRGAVLVAPTAAKKDEKPDFDDTDPDRRVKLDKLPEPGREFNGLLLLEPGLRKRYMECKAQVAAIESAAVKSNRGISNLSDMREHLELVESLASKSDIPRSELRVYSLDLLRSMSLELELKRA